MLYMHDSQCPKFIFFTEFMLFSFVSLHLTTFLIKTVPIYLKAPVGILRAIIFTS